MDNDSKLRLLYLEKMLQNTDEAHPLTNAEMMRLLEEKYGITTHRTTIPSDIDLLIKSGMEIEVIESKPKKYYLNDYARMFSLPELKMLVDAVASSKFITKKKSDELIEKIAALGTPSSAPSLNRKGDFYILRAKGDSMADAGIDEDDLLVIERNCPALEGDIVVALDEDNQNTLKRYAGYDEDSGYYILEYENEERYPGKTIKLRSFQVQGVARHVIKSL